MDAPYKIGKNILISIEHVRGSYRLLFDALKSLPYLKVYPVRSVLYKQVYFTGIEAMNKVALMGILIGIVIITQVSNIVGFNPVLIGRILVWTVVRELGPLFVAIIVLSLIHI
ncbi:MAG: ABC transporter permease, partial [Syntrophorhabdaceae bacterium]|nr:ABC transporter permease [Syntrophorhabdaceae bacterium]